MGSTLGPDNPNRAQPQQAAVDYDQKLQETWAKMNALVDMRAYGQAQIKTQPTDNLAHHYTKAKEWYQEEIRNDRATLKADPDYQEALKGIRRAKLDPVGVATVEYYEQMLERPGLKEFLQYKPELKSRMEESIQDLESKIQGGARLTPSQLNEPTNDIRAMLHRSGYGEALESSATQKFGKGTPEWDKYVRENDWRGLGKFTPWGGGYPSHTGELQELSLADTFKHPKTGADMPFKRDHMLYYQQEKRHASTCGVGEAMAAMRSQLEAGAQVKLEHYTQQKSALEAPYDFAGRKATLSTAQSVANQAEHIYTTAHSPQNVAALDLARAQYTHAEQRGDKQGALNALTTAKGIVSDQVRLNEECYAKLHSAIRMYDPNYDRKPPTLDYAQIPPRGPR